MLARSALALVLCSAGSLPAQVCTCSPEMFPAKWAAYASTGLGVLEVSSTNNHLAGAGLPSVSDGAMGFGLGGYYVVGPLRLGAEHVWLDAGRESTPGGLSSRLASSHTLVSIGYTLLTYRRVSVVPMFGMGRAHQVLVVGDRAGGPTPPANPAPTFDDVLNSPGRSSRLSGAQWIWEPMISADAAVLTKPGSSWGITLGIRAGYRVGPNRPTWQYKGREAFGGPVDQANGPVLQFIAGYGHR